MSSIHDERILYQDDHFLGVQKLAGELVVKGAGRIDKLPLLDFLKKDFPGLHPLNRLDFETSGVVLFARNSDILKTVVDSDFEGWKKTYRTVLAGVLKRDKGEIKFRLPARQTIEKVDAETQYRVLERFRAATYLEADIFTGRHHQIRKHFSMIGHPLALDTIYGEKKYNLGFTKTFKYHRFFLHAFATTFPHPYTKKIIHIEAPLPRLFEELLKKLRRVG